MTMPQHDPNLLAYLQAWRQYLEQVASAAVAPGFPFPVMPQMSLPAVPLAPPPLPPMPPGFVTPVPPAFGQPPTQPPAAPADHTQQLLMALQAWRQFLEQALGAAAAGGAEPAPVDDSSRRDKDRVPPLIENGGRASEAAGSTPPPTTPGYQTPAPRVGSAYAPEGQTVAYGGSAESAPRSLYAAAAEPDSAPGTEWWNSPTDVAAASTTGGGPHSDQTQSGPGDEHGSKESTFDPPKWKQLLKPHNLDGSLHPASPLSEQAADLVSVRPANNLQVPSLPRRSR